MNKVMIILIIVALIAGGGATFLFMQKSAKASVANKEPPKVVSVVPLAERTINLADTSTPHYLRVVMELEVVGAHALGEGGGGHGGGGGGADKYQARLMDKMILIISRQQYKKLITAEGKEHLKNELKKGFNEVFEHDGLEVQEVFFTDFVME